MEMEQGQAKWRGKASVKLPSQRAEQVWPLLEDFFGLDNWFPTLTTCLPVHGISGHPGCVRFCAGFKTPVNNTDVNWTKQKLLWIDKDAMRFSYSIVEGNVGFNNYVSEVKVVGVEDGGCEIEWVYEVDPVKGWRLEDLDLFIASGLEVMAQRMEAALQVYNNITCSD